ncbi:TerD family protein [Streptomyces paludis]|uniref:Export associated protein n=1 Tax=Streptomyces paludis TaxID=2282738 RepID=A0A345HKP9_9ACTN|nr:TerD family protein [Streptomyces paludis]AXG77273.1 export associated protein [Streptomyces paludis]
MTAELVRGQNHPLPRTRLEIRVTAAAPVLGCVTLGDEHGTTPDAGWTAHPGSPALPGVEVSRQAAAALRFHIDLAALPERARLVRVVLALPESAAGPARFGATAAPFAAVTSTDGAAIADFTLTGLDAESAVIALELYRREDAWKVRAVGQGYAGGLAELLADQGLPGAGETAAAAQDAVARHLAGAVQAPAAAPGAVDYTHPKRRRAAPAPPAAPAPAPAGEPPRPVAGDATGWTMDERLYNQVWGMFEDLARTVAAYRSARDFAQSRLDRELDDALADPRRRVGAAADAARADARARHDELAERARAVLDRDLDRLTAESEVVEPALPPAYARWDSPVWHAYRPPREIPMALRLGDVHLPERPGLRIPMLIRLPLERGLWIDSGRSGSGTAPAGAAPGAGGTGPGLSAMDTAVVHAARLLAVYPPGEFTVQVIDPARSAAHALAPLTASGVLDGPPAAGAAGVASVLARLTQRVDLVQMAVRAGATGSLPAELDTAEQLLIINDFPHGFDDRAVTQLRYLADEGPSVGVHLMMVADRADAAGYGPVLDPFWRSLLRITALPDDHLADPWVGHTWTYDPLVVSRGSRVVRQVLGQVADARRTWRR